MMTDTLLTSGRSPPASPHLTPISLAGHRPQVWVSDLYGAQRGHADAGQICLAHQLRDCQYATDAGDALFAPRLKQLLLRAIVIGRRQGLKPGTRARHRADLDRRLDAVMALQPTHKDGRRLRQRYGRFRDHLFTFITDPTVPPDQQRLRARPQAQRRLPQGH